MNNKELVNEMKKLVALNEKIEELEKERDSQKLLLSRILGAGTAVEPKPLPSTTNGNGRRRKNRSPQERTFDMLSLAYSRASTKTDLVNAYGGDRKKAVRAFNKALKEGKLHEEPYEYELGNGAVRNCVRYRGRGAAQAVFDTAANGHAAHA